MLLDDSLSLYKFQLSIQTGVLRTSIPYRRLFDKSVTKRLEKVVLRKIWQNFQKPATYK
jgi:hypothetical protein